MNNAGSSVSELRKMFLGKRIAIVNRCNNSDEGSEAAKDTKTPRQVVD
jgi:hypothetical protein